MGFEEHRWPDGESGEIVVFLFLFSIKLKLLFFEIMGFFGELLWVKIMS